jgi:hypothetical protein
MIAAAVAFLQPFAETALYMVGGGLAGLVAALAVFAFTSGAPRR